MVARQPVDPEILIEEREKTMDEVVLQEKQGDITILWLNWPDLLNAINAALLASLVAHIRDNRNSRALVLQGMGRAFCAGEDLKETLTSHPGNTDELRRTLEALQEITRFSQVSLSCDRRSAWFRGRRGAEIALVADLSGESRIDVFVSLRCPLAML